MPVQQGRGWQRLVDSLRGGGQGTRGASHRYLQGHADLRPNRPGRLHRPAATAETCNGEDDDCDGQTDEGSCDDKNACTQDVCDGKGGCKHTPQNGTACDADGSACTPADVCQAGTCTAGPALNCNDNNPCTTDSCDLAKGCTHTAGDGVPCEDDNPCTVGDVCQAGQCQGGPAKTCAAPDGCQTAVCDLQTGKCKYGNAADTTPCDDGLPCTTADACAGGACKGVAKLCDDGNPCTQDLCEPKTGCAAASQGAIACDDGNACTSGDTCQGGQCTGKAQSCDDENPCTTDSCDVALGCAHSETTAACDDGNPCSKGDTCAAGKCQPGASVCACQSDADCPDDDNLCNGLPFCDKSAGAAVCKVAPLSLVLCSTSLDTGCAKSQCDPGTGKCAMKSLANGANCEDGSACTQGDACQVGACLAGTAVACDDGNPCTTDSCDGTAGCTHAPQTGSPCDADGSVCTAGDLCQGGVCTKGAALGCDDGNACTTDSCDPAKGCVSVAAVGACSDGDPCTQGDACQAGKCVPGAAVCACQQDSDCPGDGNLCNGVDFCDKSAVPVACKAKPNTAVVCDNSQDGACAVNTCAAKTGTCAMVSKDDGASCSDGSACTAGDACKAGACAAGATVACDDGNPCTADSCDAGKGCVFAVSAGKQLACYGGPAGTQGKGICVGGKQTCDDKGVLGACQGAVVPAASELCNGLDDTCDGVTDEGCKAKDFELGFAAARLQGNGPTYGVDTVFSRNLASGKATSAGPTAIWWGFWRWYKGVLP